MKYILENRLDDLPTDLDYSGYLWYSDKSEPIILNKSRILIDTNSTNPFIIEGHLYNTDYNLSFSMSHTMGKTIVYRFDLNSIPGNWVSDEIDDTIKYIFNSPFSKYIVFKRFWKPEVDKLCSNMCVLKPAFFVFVRFE